MITIEDLIEEIVGELRDEYDTDEEDDIQKISDTVYQVLGSTSLDDIAETLSLPLTSDDYDSIAGISLIFFNIFQVSVKQPKISTESTQFSTRTETVLIKSVLKSSLGKTKRMRKKMKIDK